MNLEQALLNLPHAYGAPQAKAIFKQSPEDFKVDEVLGFELTGEGEHLFLHMEKMNLNTEQLAGILAQAFEVPKKAVTYAGLKDKFAVTTQWFNVHLPGKIIDDLTFLNGDNYRLLQAKRHSKKLKIGYLKGNNFFIRLKDVQGDKKELEDRLNHIKSKGVPNYFGEQRFGHQGQNLVKAKEVLLNNKKVKNKFLRGIYYSAARAFLFNQVLARRLVLYSWPKAINGDVLQLAGSHSFFHAQDIDDEIENRIQQFDISPAGPLWGEGKLQITDLALQELEKALESWQSWCDALESQRLKLAYRPFILVVEKMEWQWRQEDLELTFFLPAGAYATSVLRELIA